MCGSLSIYHHQELASGVWTLQDSFQIKKRQDKNVPQGWETVKSTDNP